MCLGKKKYKLIFLSAFFLSFFISSAIYCNNYIEKLKSIPKYRYSQERIIVKYKPHITKTKAEILVSKEKCKILEEILPRVFTVQISEGENVISTLEKFINSPDVEYAEPDYVMEPATAIVAPNDPYFSAQWGLRKIEAHKGWGITTGSSDIIIAVVDSGVDLNHPDLGGKLVQGWDFKEGDREPNDTSGHGTVMAGIIGAITNNLEGIAGVTWGCKIMPVKVGPDPAGRMWASDVTRGIMYAVQNGARVINLSWITHFEEEALKGPRSVKDAISYAVSQKCVVVTSTGNDNNKVASRIAYPAKFSTEISGLIAVGATNQIDERCSPVDWPSSPGQPEQGSNYGPEITVVAPGSCSYSTSPTYWVSLNYLKNLCKSGGWNYQTYYDEFWGTSVATAYVSGLAALILSINPDLTPEQVKDIIKNNADDIVYYKGSEIAGRGFDNYTGYGRINIYKIIEYL